ncbi:phage head completion protein [Sandarakinorhabdus oryzae]|uniref:phage head completion protein n=1 Tax=Sandarakinorhabdus oryzae TaxID=2675220 RepID=UPI0012E2AEA1|nr:head-tail adaptor protein [Sandarakinorhabdus oryzae]
MDGEQAGALDERVTIERWQAARDAAADDVGRWMVVETVFAQVNRDGAAARQVAGEAVRSDRRWQVVLRDRDDLGLTVRLRWRDQILTVRVIDREPRRRDFATLWCDGQPA